MVRQVGGADAVQVRIRLRGNGPAADMGMAGQAVLLGGRAGLGYCSHVGRRSIFVEGGFGQGRCAGHDQPTAPSICSSISLLSSRAYSIGNSRAIGSTKPRTIMAIASSSVSPRLIR